MAPIDLLWQLPLIIILTLGGMFFHELLHFVFGYLFGGTPFFTGYWFGVPTQVDYETPEAMSDQQVQLTAGIVTLSPLSILLFFAVSTPAQVSELFWAVIFITGASGVSWIDMFAMTHPGLWKRFTNGESISRDDLE